MVVSVERRGAHAIVWIDNPPVNATSQAVRAALMDALAEIEADDAVEGAVIACRGRTFIAGADVKEFGRPPEPPHLPDVIAAIEACPKPIVAAIHGTALGGGLEVALGCHGRVMARSAKAGLPEVTLGLIPGAGGTQRLPRLIGLIEAARMVTTGKPLGAAKAEAIGLADAVCADEALIDEALALIPSLDPAIRRLSSRDLPAFDDDALGSLETETRRRAKGQIAPLKALDALRAACGPFAAGLAAERAIFLELRASPQSAALRHIFFAERAAAKAPDAAATPMPLQTVGVVGGGTMGVGIALAMLGGGLAVTLVEMGEDALERAVARIGDVLDDMVAKGRLSPVAAESRRASLSGSTALEALSDTDLVIEAIYEDLGAKRELFAKLGAIVKPDAVLATNTSYLDVDAIAEAGGRSAQTLGLHFFSPAHIMKLLEIVRGAETSPEAIATGLALAKRLGKLPVIAGNAFGFIGNRIFSAYRTQGEYLVEEGATPADVDRVMEDWGMAMGPFAVADLAGLDIARAVRRMLAPTRDTNARTAAIADALCEANRLGRKTADVSGGGWYDYEAGRRTESPQVAGIVEAERAAKGIAPRAVPDDEIRARMTAAMVNAAGHLLGEGVAARPGDVDVVLVNGYGFPRWRGGPVFDAQARGWDVVRAEVAAMCEASGAGWVMAPWLTEQGAD